MVARALVRRSSLGASLLAGEMPEGIEETFRTANAALFPESDDDFQTDCSCPDWANPCKHVAAVHFL
ncbi:MAG TPA: SWIM zinc finger family protein, partial [Thermoplasmata archaeon]|nr:SWIM zinc finger family protein [Thermoplasmata archaeon]